MMINQRCRNGRSSYRPPDEVINTFHYEIAPIESDSEAKAFVRLHHYAHSFPAARYRFGLPDGTVFNERSAQKIRSEERGWESAARRLEHFGAPQPPQKQAARKEWLNQWREKLTRRIWHEGNFKYAWGLERSTKRALPPSLPYPKLTRAQLALWEPATKNVTKQ